MKHLVIGGLAAIAALAAATSQAEAGGCAAGVYRAGCAGPNGAVVAKKPVAPPAHVNCASGPYRAGCAGPNGAAVVTKPAPTPYCYWRNGVKVCR